ncbi:hypothetical protein CL1_1041 [Thermococcus cleftensis]|uniref:Uncharacterized protein n=1 Tax=Thermococcus cleftensis (strain DSM 27260 / KACC 17922 / CL1) TaxID=163003 RepID=I3ZU60_THECF|nr:hypothetical protein [Thermococcus cleftensis]AFL95244.1 hypothetical protein CL1_1041 [Thermococcus cleftensis]
MVSENAVRVAISVPAVVLAVAVLAVGGFSPETMLVLVLLWVAGALLPRAWEFRNGKLELAFLLRNVLLYAALVVLVGAEYLLLEESVYGVSKEVVMFFTAWLLSGIFEFLWPGFARKGATQVSP